MILVEDDSSMNLAYTYRGLVIQLLFLYTKIVHERRNVDPKLLDMVTKLVARVEAIELVQNHGRQLYEVESVEYDYFWDDLHERIDDLEKHDLSWHLRIRKKVSWLVKEIMKRRR